jgi:transketolase
MTYQALVAAKLLAEKGINAEVVHVPTIKPLDVDTLVESVKRTGRVVTMEEAQAAGGFGSAVAEALSEHLPCPIKRIGMQDRFGESGEPDQLLEHFGLDAKAIARSVEHFVNNSYQYHR